MEPNPIVGAIIVHDEKIIGSGYHMKYGGPHAEVNAINSVQSKDRHLLEESTIYVSLEPCYHFGKTPPCVNTIIQHKIPRVVISCSDPNPKVNGLSIAKLKKVGIEVETGILEKEGLQLIKDFVAQHS